MLWLLALQALASLASLVLNGAAPSLTVGTAGFCLAAALALLAGVGAAQRGWKAAVFGALAWSLILAGLLNTAVELVQIIRPDWTDGRWLAQSQLKGRGIGNLRQPNLVALVCVWALLGCAWLRQVGRTPALVLYALALGLVLGVVLSASRAGQLFLVLLVAYGAWLKWRRVRGGGLLLAVLPFAAASLALHAVVAQHLASEFGAAARLVEGASSPPRWRIIQDAWALTLEHPWSGVGWGELNFAWTLHPNPLRTQYYFDHTHVLLLQWAVELGLPLALLFTALLGWSLWRALRAALAELRGPEPHAFALVAIGVLHNQLEFPFWYAWFLLPAALSLGLCLGGRHTAWPHRAGKKEHAPWVLLGLVQMLLAALVAFDYLRAVPVFHPGPDGQSIEHRLEGARRSVLFSAQTEWGAATKQRPVATLAHSDEVGAHWVVDARLLWSWARTLELAGQGDKARFLAARLREFPGAEAQRPFEVCKQGLTPEPFQCQAPLGQYDYTDFR
jgi:O-antigen ligase